MGFVLAAIIACSVVLDATGLWWGAPSLWAGDELHADGGLRRDGGARFSHGWFERYLPFHYYVLSATVAPWLVLKWLGAIQLTTRAETVLLIVLEAIGQRGHGGGHARRRLPCMERRRSAGAPGCSRPR